MTSRIVRSISDLLPVTIGVLGSLPGGSSVVQMGEHAGGMIHMENFTANQTRTLRFHICPDPALPNETLLLCEKTGNSTELVVEMIVHPNRSYALPDELFASRMFRITANVAVSARILLKT